MPLPALASGGSGGCDSSASMSDFLPDASVCCEQRCVAQLLQTNLHRLEPLELVKAMSEAAQNRPLTLSPSEIVVELSFNLQACDPAAANLPFYFRPKPHALAPSTNYPETPQPQSNNHQNQRTPPSSSPPSPPTPPPPYSKPQPWLNPPPSTNPSSRSYV